MPLQDYRLMSDALMKKFEARAHGIYQAVTIIIAMLLSMNVAIAEDFHVKYDQAKLLRLARPAHDIIVGNPSIADVAIQGKQLLVVTGKSFGVTNLIVLDDAGAVILNRKMIVKGDDRKFVNLLKGRSRQSYNCTPQCQAALIAGDGTKFGSDVSKAIQQKSAVSTDGASSQSGN